MGMGSIAIPERTITHKGPDGGPGPKFGKKIKVETPDHIVGVMEFENGAVGTIIQSFATIYGGHDGKHPITINGTDAAIKVPDPNNFDGTVHLKKFGQEWEDVPHQFVTGYGRSVGAADMAYAIRSGRPHRASAEQAFAVLDLMAAFLDSSDTGKEVRPVTRYERVAPMPAHLPFGQLDE
jgi:predicted dehydrogenase